MMAARKIGDASGCQSLFPQVQEDIAFLSPIVPEQPAIPTPVQNGLKLSLYLSSGWCSSRMSLKSSRGML